MAGPLSADRVAQTTTTTGTGTLSLDASIASGARGFVSGIGSTNTCFYCIVHQSADEWEVGIGTVTDAATDTLSRTTILASSNAGLAVNLTAGTKDVFCVAPAVYGLPLVQLPTTYAIRRSSESLGGATVGNARGSGAVDLQHARNAATQVASGNYAVIGGGYRNTASGACSVASGGNTNIASGSYSAIAGGRVNTASANYSFVGGGYSNLCQTGTHMAIGGGFDNTASGTYSCIGGGNTNTASGQGSCVPGGTRNVASGVNSVAFGERASATRRAQVAHSAGMFAAQGDAQSSQHVLRCTTSNGAQTEMFLDGSSERMALPNDTTWAFRILVTARRTDANDESAAYSYHGCIDRNASAAATALVGTVTESVIAEDTAAWSVSVDADTTNGSLRVQVTGEAAKTIQWVAHVLTVEVTG